MDEKEKKIKEPQVLEINEDRNNEDFKIAEKWAIIGIVGNLFLSILKFIAGILGGSSAMIADAVHSASDIVASAVVYASLLIAKKPADEDHPFGHGKAEAIAASIVGMMLLAAGFQILKSAYSTIAGGSIQAPKIIALIAAIISILSKELLFRFTYKVGKKINSPSTIANAYDHRSDAFSSIATFIGIGGAMLGFPIMDPIAGGIVAVFVLKMGYDIIVEASQQIMDSSAEDEVVKDIKKVVAKTPGVKDVHGLRVRQSGPFYMADLDICVDGKLTLDEAHKICDNAREKVFELEYKILEVRVHIDPFKKIKV